MKIEIEHLEELLNRSKGDIFTEDFIAENGIEEGSDEEFIYENFNSIKNYVITRLETRLAFMKNTLKEESEMIKIQTPYYFKGSSCLFLYISSIEGEDNRYTMRSEYEQLFMCESFEEVIKRYKELKDEVYA